VFGQHYFRTTTKKTHLSVLRFQTTQLGLTVTQGTLLKHLASVVAAVTEAVVTVLRTAVFARLPAVEECA